MPSSKSSQHKLFSRHRFTNAFRPFYSNKKVAALSILLFAAIGVTATYITNAAQIANEETVVLSTGQQIKLGQDINSLKAALGNKLFKLNNNQYIYRQRANAPIEVVVDLDNNQNVVVLHLANKPTNMIAATNSRVGMSILGAKYFLRDTSPLPPSVASLRSNGLVVNQTRSSQYLTTELCSSNNQQASLVSLVLKGHEEKYIRDLGDRNCIDKK
jgi:hypothetical protein